MRRLLALMAILALGAFAGDISGTWKATAEGPNGTIERTFTFKQDGAKLTGETVSSMFGKSTIEDGKVEGDNVTFSVTIKFQDNEMKVNYTGKLTGDTLKLNAAVGGQTIEWTAKKVS
jgi:hypothetical protein